MISIKQSIQRLRLVWNPTQRWMWFGVALAVVVAIALLLSFAFGRFDNDKVAVRLATIGALDMDSAIAIPRAPLSSAEEMLRAATAQGLVSYDSQGQIEAGLAERWNITDDGLSYIFRIREARWDSDDGRGEKVTARQVATILNRYLDSRRGHILRGEFPEIATIRAMTDHVIEIRLKQPQPFLLDLLAQPSMGIAQDGRGRARGRGWGPLRARQQPRGASSAVGSAGAIERALAGRSNQAQIPAEAVLVLSPVADPDLLVENSDSLASSQDKPAPMTIELYSMSAPAALAQFDKATIDGVVGGRFDDFPYYIASDIPQSALRVDPTAGLFGLVYRRGRSFWAFDSNREAIAMVIRRERIIEAFQYEPWRTQATLQPSENIANPSADLSASLPAWSQQTYEQRLKMARERVQAYRARQRRGYKIPPINIALPSGPGGRIVFAYIAADLRRIGLEARKVALDDTSADLRLIDEVAVSEDPIWALRRLNCGRGRLCKHTASGLIHQAETTSNPQERTALLREAETLVAGHFLYIPLATPLRWSLVAENVTGFQPNPRAQHRLDLLIEAS